MANAVAGGYYPAVGFHFKVEFVGLGTDNDTRFQTVSGLALEYETESYKEGGENRFEHSLPVRTKYTPLTLKRGLLSDSAVIAWCLSAFQDRVIHPIQVHVSLLNESHQPLKTWQLFGAWPKKWSVADLNAQESAVLVETLEICYSYFKTN